MRITLFVILFCAAALASSVLWSEVVSSFSFELAFFNVGQGDAVFFETPQGHQVLIDGGPDSAVLSRLGEVMPFFDKTIDLVILTHPDADHITGLVAVFERYKVENVLWTGRTKDTKIFEAFKEALRKEGAREILAQAGQKILFGGSQAALEILYPGREVNLQEEVSNETSIIAKLTFAEHAVMLPGDTVKRVERQLLEQRGDLNADILKVAHHGSATSSKREFLEAVAPKTAVISVSKDNRYGHPSQETLANLAEYGITIRRTDKEGTILFHFK